LTNFGWPDRSAQSEKASFKLQCDRHEDVPIDQNVINMVNDIVLPQYIEHSMPACLEVYNRQEWDKYIDFLKECVKPDASPGVPYMDTASTNKKLFDTLGKKINNIILDRIEKLLSIDKEIVLNMTPMERIDIGLVDPVRVFVKDEPHKLKKLLEGRVRLIMSVSIVDKIIEMLLHRHCNKLEIEYHNTIPSKPGMGFDVDETTKIYDEVHEMSEPTGQDVQGWDWSYQGYMTLNEVERRRRLTTNWTIQWFKIAYTQAICFSHVVFMFSDGIMVTCNYDGIQLSGRYLTSSSNSYGRVFIGNLVALIQDTKNYKIIANGDDSVEEFIEGSSEVYEELGFKIKQCEKIEDQFEFCSNIYYKNCSYTNNPCKTLMNLLHQDVSDKLMLQATMLQWQDEMEYCPQFQQYIEVLKNIGFFDLAGSQNESTKLRSETAESGVQTTTTTTKTTAQW